MVRRRTEGVAKSPDAIPIGPLRSRETSVRTRRAAVGDCLTTGTSSVGAGAGVTTVSAASAAAWREGSSWALDTDSTLVPADADTHLHRVAGRQSVQIDPTGLEHRDGRRAEAKDTQLLTAPDR